MSGLCRTPPNSTWTRVTGARPPWRYRTFDWFRQRVESRLPSGSFRRALVSGASWSVAGSVASRSLTLLTTVVAARVLGTEEFGQWSLLYATASVVVVFGSLGLAHTATKHVAEAHQDPVRAMNVTRFTVTTAALAATTAAFCLALVSSAVSDAVFGDRSLATGVRWVAVWVLFAAVNVVQGGALSGFHEFRRYAVINLLSSLAGLLVVWPAATSYGVPGAVAAFAVAQGVACALNGVALRRVGRRLGVPSSWRGAWSERSVLWHFALPAVLGSGLVVPVTWLANLYLSRGADGFRELAIFTAADQWRTILFFIPASMGSATLAVLTQRTSGGSELDGGVLGRTAALNVTVTLLPAAVLMILAPWISSALYGPGFSEAAWPMRILAATAVFMAASAVPSHALAAMSSMWLGFAVNAVWATVFGVVAIVAVPDGGARGLALAYLVSYALHAVLGATVTARMLRA